MGAFSATMANPTGLPLAAAVLTEPGRVMIRKVAARVPAARPALRDLLSATRPAYRRSLAQSYQGKRVARVAWKIARGPGPARRRRMTMAGAILREAARRRTGPF